MAATATIDANLSVVETLAITGDLIAGAPTITHQIAALASKVTLNATSTPVITKAWSDRVTLAAGVLTIALDALVQSAALAAAVDFTGLKVQAAIFQAPTSNTDPVVIAPGAVNGYNLFGDASGQVTLAPGGVMVWFAKGGESLPDVGGSASDIDLSSTDQTADLDIILVAG